MSIARIDAAIQVAMAAVDNLVAAHENPVCQLWLRRKARDHVQQIIHDLAAGGASAEGVTLRMAIPETAEAAFGDHVVATGRVVDDRIGFAFELGQQLRIKVSGERGEVVGRAEYSTGARDYRLRYVSKMGGAATEQWWDERALTESGGLK